MKFTHVWPMTPCYYVSHKWKDFPDGGGTNFTVFRNYKRAYRLHMKQPVKHRHMDIRFHNRLRLKPYCVMQGRETTRWNWRTTNAT